MCTFDKIQKLEGHFNVCLLFIIKTLQLKLQLPPTSTFAIFHEFNQPHISIEAKCTWKANQQLYMNKLFVRQRSRKRIL